MPLNILNAQTPADRARALLTAARFQDAADLLLAARRADPHSPLLPALLGDAFAALHQDGPALAAYADARRLDPAAPGPCNNAANLLAYRGLHSQAIPLFQRAADLASSPLDRAGALNNLAESLFHQGDLLPACDLYHQAADLAPPLHPIRSNPLRALTALPGFDPLLIRQRHQAFWQPLADFHPPAPPPMPPRTGPLRLGFVSPDLRHHAVASFLLPLLEHALPNQFQFFCYANVPRPDAISQRIAAHSHWRNIAPLSDLDAAALIRADNLHALFDLAGHTANHRLTLFALNPAPLHISWLGYPQTTGSPFIHYRLTDPLADPPGLTEAHNTERLLRLPRSAWCYTPLVPLPPPPQNLPPRPFTFGSFNALFKLSPTTRDLWTAILRHAPDSRLLLKNPALADPVARQRLTDDFAARGIAPHRLSLLPFTSDPADHLAAYHLIDLALDTFPYHGTTTTCEALTMNVPLLTLAGQTHASRVGASLLTNAGLPHLITTTPEDYITHALHLAATPPTLHAARTTLHQTLPTSPLQNPQQFLSDLTTILLPLLS